ncbi:flavodoxin family protein [Hymenobacter psychrophilus]|uniref:NAD(P)H-dependent FMN reductase n=1 Tax=Hymenobacter psychrophilus TaxID=651662 RepID=A0A1H3LNV6_9BACT|nr:NAD(P)H-dependent oxidoreductase [Hymenobacter psychrophilus]SDY66112.1 NAD(P)H-dependent FMN reductase [Hymenobacter psychrophilus]
MVNSTRRRFLFLLGSTRRSGNSELLARRAAEFLPAATEQQWLFLPDYPLPPFIDRRHDDHYPTPTAGPEKTLLAATLAATDLVLVSPLYWYALSTPAKHYLDYWSAWLRGTGLDFRAQMRGKTLWAVVAGSGPEAEARPLHEALQLTASYMPMAWGGYLYGNGSRPGDVRQDAAAWQAAEGFFGPAST